MAAVEEHSSPTKVPPSSSPVTAPTGTSIGQARRSRQAFAQAAAHGKLQAAFKRIVDLEGQIQMRNNAMLKAAAVPADTDRAHSNEIVGRLALAVPVLCASMNHEMPTQIDKSRRNAAMHCFDHPATELARMDQKTLNRIQRAGRQTVQLAADEHDARPDNNNNDNNTHIIEEILVQARFAAHQLIASGPCTAVALPAPVVDLDIGMHVRNEPLNIGTQLHNKALSIEEDLNTLCPETGEFDEGSSIGMHMHAETLMFEEAPSAEDISFAFWGWAAYISQQRVANVTTLPGPAAASISPPRTRRPLESLEQLPRLSAEDKANLRDDLVRGRQAAKALKQQLRRNKGKPQYAEIAADLEETEEAVQLMVMRMGDLPSS